MKKFFLMAIAVMGFATASMAADNNKSNVTVNSARLSAYLELSDAQYETIEAINNDFEASMAEAEKVENNEERANKMRKAVLDNCKKMRENLNDVQYSKYLSVINATINNKGLQSVVK
ncbi:MAG: hypothetical protein J5676_01390 [Bacteroidaceae bacterium]|nr:hypothetical protein [Bacteroidaceae bacterium]